VNNDGNYVCDQWILLSDGNDVADVFKETSVVPAYAPTALKAVVQGTNKKFGFFQPMPNDLVRSYSGNTVSLQFKARNAGSGDLTLIRAAVVAWDGTADTITRDIVSAWNTTGTNPTLITSPANWTYANTPAALTALTGTYQTFTIANITVPASTNNLGVFIWCEDTSYTASDSLYIADVKLEIGTAASGIHHRPMQDELARAQDFFRKTFNLETAPADNLGTAGAICAVSVLTGGGHSLTYSWRFPRKMAKAPTITTYNPGSGTASYWMAELPTPGSFKQAGADRIGTDGCRLYNAVDANDGYMYSIHAVADARL